MKIARILVACFVALFFLPYEILGVSEDFLYTISFVVFMYNLLIAISTYAVVELENRKIQIRLLFTNLVELRRTQVKRLHSFFDYVKVQDLEYNFYTSLNILKTHLVYNFYLNFELVNFSTSIYDISEINYVLFRNNILAELEEVTLEFFDNN